MSSVNHKMDHLMMMTLILLKVNMKKNKKDNCRLKIEESKGNFYSLK